MKQKLLLILVVFCSLLLQQNVKAQTLVAGDIAFIGVNTDNPDSFSFICLKALPAGETLYFTDHGWENTQWAPGITSEAHMAWVIPSGITCGTIVNVSTSNGTTFTLTGAGGSFTLVSNSGTTSFTLPPAGDQVLAYQSTTGFQPASPTFIAGVNMNYAAGNMAANGWDNAVINSTSNSTLPTGLTNGVNCVALYNGTESTTEPNNTKYNYTANPLTGTASQVRGNVNDRAKWNFDNVATYDLSPTAYGTPSVTCSATITASTTSLSSFTACSGTNSTNQTFTVSGNALSNNITVTAPTGFEVSLSAGSGFGSSVDIIPIGNSVTNVTVYVRTTTTATGTPSGNITLSSSPATSVNVAVNGTVTTTPNVTAHPSGSSICAGANTTFSVTASSATGYQWYVSTNGGTNFNPLSNTAPYSGTTSATLTITGSTAGMSGYQYRAIATGNCNPPAFSNAATLTVTSGPAITANPSASTICPGANTTFTATASNATGYQWQVDQGAGFNSISNNALYSGATTATLTITGATAGLNGYIYRVVATGSCTPNATSIGAALTVSSSPSVTANPPNRTICTGNNTTFTVTATGATGYQWQVSTDGGNNYNDISNGAPYSGVTTATLTVTGATSAITGYRYRCTVSSGCGSTNSNGGTLTVSTIAIGQSQTNVTTYGGGNGTATATPSGGIPTYTYSWSPSGGTSATATGLTAGTYTVIVSDAISCSSTSANYVITQPAGVATSVSTLVAFATCSGTASANKTFTVNGGSGLTADVVVTAPTGYEVSLSPGSGFGSSVTITQSGGAIATTTIYVRMAASASGIMSGNVAVSSTGVTTKNVSVTGLASNLSASSYTVTGASCFGGSNGVIDLTPSGGAPSYSYNWGGGITTQDRTGLTAGNYSVTITDGNGCTYTISNIVVGQPAAALDATYVATSIACNGNSTGTINITASGGTGSYSYDWGGGINTEDRTGLPAGVYSVTITDGNSCTKTISNITLTQPAAALSAATGGGKTDVSCFGGANGTATVTATGGTTTYSYSWDTTPVQTTATATGLTAGTYTVTVTDAMGCQATRSFTINQPASSLTATQGTINNVSCFNGSNGSAQVIASGGTPLYTYSWSPSGGSGSIASGLAAGTYTVTVTDNKGCTATQSFTINQPASALSAAIGGGKTDVSCNGGANGTATVAPTGGTPGYTYQWSPSGGTAATATGLVAGTYTVIVTDSHGCQASRTFTINQPAAAVNASPVMQTNIACRGNATGSATVSASGGTPGYTYSWAPSGGNAATASNLAAGTYTVTVTDANGCIDTQSFTITQPAAVLSTTAGTVSNVSCNSGANGTAQVIASGGTPGYTYSWAPSGGSNATANGLTAGTYTVTVTDSYGCTATRNFTITQPPALVASQGIINNVSCNGGTNGTATVAVTGGTPGYTYSWSPTGGTGATASGLVAGTYTVTVTDANSCQSTQSFTINQPTALTSGISKTDVLCNGGATGTATVTPTGGTTNYTYLWSPSGGTAATATGLVVGNYSCIITDANGCSITKNITINQPSLLGATTSQTNATCSAGGNASVTPFGGMGGYTYLWSPGGQTTQSVTGLSAGNYSCLITDANGCIVTKNFIITTNNTLVASTFQTNLLCNGVNTGSAGVIPAGAPGPYTYVWSPSGGNADTATNLAAGTYSVLITASNGCSITKSFTITQPTALVATAGAQSNVSCNGGTNGSATVAVTGGTGAYTYSWAPSGGTAATANGLAAGTYTVTVRDANLCQTTQSFTITQPTILAVVSSQTDVSCNGGNNGSATVAVTGGTGMYTYLWAPSGGTAATAATASGLAAGTYTVTVKDANLCQTTQSFTITEPAPLTATTSQTNILCNGGATGSATVTASGGTAAYTYSWAPSGGTAATATGLTAGTYTCTITDAKGCFIAKTFTLTQPSALVASAGTQNNVSCNGGSNGTATVIVTGGSTPYNYDWNGTPIGDNTATISGLSAGTYTATVTDANGCTTNQIFTITQPAALTATTSQVNVSCFGANNGSATVVTSGGTGAYTYSWNTTPVQTTATATGLAAGNYTVTISDANSCSITRNFTITGTSAFTITPTQTNVTCNGAANGTATVAVTGGTGIYTYAWAPSGGTAATATGLAPGTYSVAITDGNGCTASQSFTITQPTVITVSGTSSNISCHGAANGVANAFATGGTGPYTYSWAPSGGNASSATGLSAGTYVCTVTDANGCTQTRSFIIYEQTPIIVTSVKTNILCNGVNNGSATVSATGGVPGYTYAWSTGSGGPTISNLAAGTYTCTVSDALGCSAVHTVVITEPTALSVTTTQTNVLCSGNSDGSIAVEVSGGVAPYNYAWTPSLGTGASITGLSAGNYSVTITDANGCSTLRNFSLTQPAPLTASLTKTDVSCFGNNDGTAIATVTGGTPPYTFEWISPLGGTPDPQNLVAGTYTVTITDDNGCTFTGSVTINQPVQLIISSHPQNVTINAGGNATYSVIASNAFFYQWQYSTDGTNWINVVNGGSNPTYSGATTATLVVTGAPNTYDGYLYRVQVKNNANCIIASNSALLNINDILIAVNDDFSTIEILEGTGGIAGDVTLNDTYNGSPVNDNDIVISVVDNDGLFGATIDADGNLIVPVTATVGTFTVTYSICSVTDNTNCSTAEATVVVTSVTGTDDFRNLELSIYPNPATTSVNIKIPDFSVHQNIKLSIHDLNGRIVRENIITSDLEKIDVTGMESGVYLFRITSDTAEATRKVVIDKKF